MMDNHNALSEEDLKILESLRKDNEERKKIPEDLKSLITNPDKFSAPFGVNDEGEFFPVINKKTER